MSRVIWLVLDSLGIGAAPDAADWGDQGADTFGHIAAACATAARGPLRLPNLSRLGLPHAHAAAQGRVAAGFADLPARTHRPVTGKPPGSSSANLLDILKTPRTASPRNCCRP